MTDTTPFRIAGAPISWGVCEVPGWGYQLGPDKVLAEMREVGLAATELGPEGFLPGEPDAMAKVLSEHHLLAVGGFTPTVLHVPGYDPLPAVDLGGESCPQTILDLSPMRLGEGSWTERALMLRGELGPFRLAYLEALLRAADLRASADERQGAGHA